MHNSVGFLFILANFNTFIIKILKTVLSNIQCFKLKSALYHWFISEWDHFYSVCLLSTLKMKVQFTLNIVIIIFR